MKIHTRSCTLKSILTTSWDQYCTSFRTRFNDRCENIATKGEWCMKTLGLIKDKLQLNVNCNCKVKKNLFVIQSLAFIGKNQPRFITWIAIVKKIYLSHRASRLSVKTKKKRVSFPHVFFNLIGLCKLGWWRVKSLLTNQVTVFLRWKWSVNYWCFVKRASLFASVLALLLNGYQLVNIFLQTVSQGKVKCYRTKS
jgi:hypothetical protein